MRAFIVCVLFAVGCSSPTAPTPVSVTPPVIAPPVVAPVTPPVAVPNPLLSDPRFDLGFYRQFALNGYERPNGLQPLFRQTRAPYIYLYTVDQAGRPIDAQTLDSTAAALINVAGQLTGAFGLEGLTQGVGPSGPNMISVQWAPEADPAFCGKSGVGGSLIVLYYKTAACGCPGTAMRPLTVKHELGHILGFHHTDGPSDLMYGPAQAGCDKTPSSREQFHAALAYMQPNGSLDPQ